MSGDFVETYEHFAGQSTDAPKIYHRHLAVWLGGAALGNRVFIRFGARRVFPNCYGLLIGDPGSTRKSTAISIAEGVGIRLGDLISFLPSDGSYEAFLASVKEHPSGVMVVSEWLQYLASRGKDYAVGIEAALCNLFDGLVHRRATQGGGAIEIQNAAISVWAAATSTSYLDGQREKDVGGGFASRWCVVFGAPPERPDYTWPQPLSNEGRADIVQHIHEHVTFLSGKPNDPREMNVSPEAQERFERYARDLSPERLPSTLRAYAARHVVALIKYATVVEAMNHASQTLSGESMDAALPLVLELRESLSKLSEDFAFSKPERDLNRVRREIKTAGVVPYRRVLRTTRLKARDLGEIVKTLVERDEITDRWEKGETGQRYRVLEWSDGRMEALENGG